MRENEASTIFSSDNEFEQRTNFFSEISGAFIFFLKSGAINFESYHLSFVLKSMHDRWEVVSRREGK